ncbi:MAG: Uma2 family endonuclease [Planctomycetes bacterium]|nr:Uma2 family endonuclease [Planctomycetota bacterium]
MRAARPSVSAPAPRECEAYRDDRWDEMWDGELHMVPPPGLDHQDIVTGLAEFLHSECRRRSMGTVYVQAGVHDPEAPTRNYRIPDLSFVARGNEGVLQPRGIVGAADSVIEVRSPDDESRAKFPFYARLKVREVILIVARTRRPEVFRLEGERYVSVRPVRDGGLPAVVLGVRFRYFASRRGLRLEAADDATHQLEV